MSEFSQYLLNPATIALILGGILTSFFGFLAGISKTERTPKWISWGSFIAGIIVLGAGILSGYQGQITAVSMQEKTAQIAEISQKNAELALNNSELSKKIANSITGGDSYCYVLVGNPSKTNLSDLMLITEGEYPLYDVEVRIHDLDQRVANFKNRIQKDISSNMSTSDFFNLINRSAKIIKIGNIGLNQGYPLGALSLPKDVDKARYEIEIMARNGRVLQLVQFRRMESKWIWAEKIYFHDKVVKRYIDPDFPKDDESKSFWED